MPYCKQSSKYELGKEKENELMAELNSIKEWDTVEIKFNALYDSMCKFLIRALQKAFKPPLDTEMLKDAFQEGWAKIITYKGQYKTGNSAFNWVFTIILNTAKDLIKKKDASNLFRDDGSLPKQLSPPVSIIPYDMLMNSSEIVNAVQENISSLEKDFEKDIITLYIFEEWTPAEIAEKYEMPLSTTYYKINKLLDSLRKTINELKLN